jgi:hypothetical protein
MMARSREVAEVLSLLHEEQVQIADTDASEESLAIVADRPTWAQRADAVVPLVMWLFAVGSVLAGEPAMALLAGIGAGLPTALVVLTRIPERMDIDRERLVVDLRFRRNVVSVPLALVKYLTVSPIGPGTKAYAMRLQVVGSPISYRMHVNRGEALEFARDVLKLRDETGYVRSGGYHVPPVPPTP